MIRIEFDVDELDSIPASERQFKINDIKDKLEQEIFKAVLRKNDYKFERAAKWLGHRDPSTFRKRFRMYEKLNKWLDNIKESMR